MIKKGVLPLASVALLLLVAVAAPAASRKAQDPTGDVTGPLDISEVAFTWNATTLAGKITVAQPIDTTIFEFGNGGNVGFGLVTRKVADGSAMHLGNYAYYYSLLILKEEGGSFYAWLSGGPINENAESLGKAKVTMPNDRTLRFAFKRNWISGDREGSRFGYWFWASYYPTLSDDFAPDGTDIYLGRF